jgi:hypothetical protein
MRAFYEPSLWITPSFLSGNPDLHHGLLGMLVFLHCWARDQGIQLTLVNPSKFVWETLELTGLTYVLHVSSVNDVVEALCNADWSPENVNRAVT